MFLCFCLCLFSWRAGLVCSLRLLLLLKNPQNYENNSPCTTLIRKLFFCLGGGGGGVGFQHVRSTCAKPASAFGRRSAGRAKAPPSRERAREHSERFERVSKGRACACKAHSDPQGCTPKRFSQYTPNMGLLFPRRIFNQGPQTQGHNLRGPR